MASFAFSYYSRWLFFSFIFSIDDYITAPKSFLSQTAQEHIACQVLAYVTTDDLITFPLWDYYIHRHIWDRVCWLTFYVIIAGLSKLRGIYCWLISKIITTSPFDIVLSRGTLAELWLQFRDDEMIAEGYDHTKFTTADESDHYEIRYAHYEIGLYVRAIAVY